MNKRFQSTKSGGEKVDSPIEPIQFATREKSAKYRVTFKAYGTIEMTDYVVANGLDEALQKSFEISKRNKWRRAQR